MPTRKERDEELMALRGGIGGSANPGGMIPTSTAGEPPVPIVLVKSHNPIAGAVTVVGSPAGTALAQLAYYQTPDNVPRKVTIFVTQNGPITQGGSPTSQLALYCKVTVGSDRGAVSQWIAAPCVFPAEGQFVKVEAMISGSAPSVMADVRVLPKGAILGTPYPGTSVWTVQATALVVDGWTDEGPSILLAKSIPCGSVAQGTAGNFVDGPVIVDSISFSNTNASAGVLMAVCDTGPGGAFVPEFQVITVYVPAQTTVSVGRDLLGTFGNGVNMIGIVAPPSIVNAEDTNGANVYATVRGRYLLAGGF